MKRPMMVLWSNLDLRELSRFGERLESLPREALEDFATECLSRLEQTHDVLQMAYEMVDSLEAEANERNGSVVRM